MMETISIINLKERVHIHGRVELVTLANLEEVREMDMEFGNQVMVIIVILMKESICKIRNMAKVPIDGVMDQYIRGNLKMM